MELTVLQENLKKALSFVSKVVSSKTQLPVLANVLLQGEEGRLKLSATNLETSITFNIGATVEKKGGITVPARVLTELVGTFTHEKVILETEQTMLKISCGRSEVTLSGIDAQEFPPLPEASNKKEATLDSKTISQGLPQILISAAGDETRPLLTGIKFVSKDGQTILVATDGYRLSVRRMIKPSLSQDLVISSRVLAEVLRMIAEEKTETIDVYFSTDHNQLIFVLPHIQIATRLIEGEYPPYQKIIPANHTTRVVFNRDELLQAVKLAAVYARESANIVRFKISQNNTLVSANTPQIGENKTEIEAEVEGEGGEIAFNARFLLDFLAVFTEPEVVFEMTGPLSPGVFKSLKDDSFLHIIMPVRVQG